ncbi:MAG TPA: MobB mobilization protein [Polyangia bacterium]|nr:MobB mobilization protein [Polyangia bacterium]
MPFRRKGPTGLTARLDVRVAPGEKEDLGVNARDAGFTVAELVRLRALGRPVVSRTDATTIRELRRLGGLLKLVHTESGGAYRQQTAELLTMLRAAVRKLAGGQ